MCVGGRGSTAGAAAVRLGRGLAKVAVPRPLADSAPMRIALHRICVLSSVTAAAAAQSLVWPGEDVATIEAPHLRAFVPAAAAERLRPLVARIDDVYVRIQADAALPPGRKLSVLFADWRDEHNGFSFVVPFPLVQVELAPALPSSPIFCGGFDTERTLVHEFAHECSNDRNQGFRGGLEAVFGRVLPNDPLSLVLWYLSTPAHQTMPRFWQEGIGQWAETSYADPASAWAGRGRDAFTHMIWRLDAANGALPEAADWRVTWQQWPFGSRAYAYGLAYTRWLEAAHGERASVWRIVQEQAAAWAFLFDRAPSRATGERHTAMLRAARADLLAEQQRQLAALRAVPVTEVPRLTPIDLRLGAPAWRPDGSLAFAAHPAQGRARLHTLTAAGELRGSAVPTLALGDVRALPDGGERTGLVWHEYDWRGIAHAVVDGRAVGRRLLMPDAGPLSAGARPLVAVRLRDGGGQELVAFVLRDGELDAGAVLPTVDVPWSPALRPGRGHDGELVWVETDRAGSRLVLGSLRDTAARRVLWTAKGRILHPVWTADGSSLFCCSDVTGVANAYRLDVAGGPAGAAATPVPVTNTLGGVIACVPSPDGRTLALVDHDARGPFVGTLPNDPARFPPRVPALDLAWPAPLAAGREPAAPGATAMRPQPLPAPAAAPLGNGSTLPIAPYRGLAELRPRFWAPSTFAVPEGGYGVFGLATDPLLTDVVQAGVGVGLVEQEPVAFVGWDHLGSVVQFGASAGRSERTFADTVHRGGEDFDYTETVDFGSVRAGRGLFALERTFQAFASLGIESHDEVDDSARGYAGGTYDKPPLRDQDHYVEGTLGYADATAYPTSYAAEDGFQVLATYRHSGLGGDLERNRALLDGGYTWSWLPTLGHQIAVRGQCGWSDGDDVLQGNFSVGGGLSTGLPRGYVDSAVATGRYLLAESLAYRLPLWRPFAAGGTGPFRGRQLVLELFGDSATVGDDRLGGGRTWSSVGAELHANAEHFDFGISPGLGVAYQLDGDRDVRFWFAMGFTF